MHDGLIGGGRVSWNLGAILAYSWIRLQSPPHLFLLTLPRDTGRSLPLGLCLWCLSHFIPTCLALQFLPLTVTVSSRGPSPEVRNRRLPNQASPQR